MDKVDLIRIVDRDAFNWTLRMYTAGGGDEDYIDMGDFESLDVADLELECILRGVETNTNWEITADED